MKKTILLTIAFMFTGFLCTSYASAQTAEEANNEFNKARELSKTDLNAAVAQLEKTLEISKKVGEPAVPIIEEIVKVIANWQLGGATAYVNAGEFTKAAKAYEKSIDLAKLYGDKETEKSATAQLPLVYKAEGDAFLQNNAPNDAFLCYEKSLRHDPNSAKVYISRSQAYKMINDEAKMEADLEKAIEIATKENDAVNADVAKKMLGISYLNDGLNAFKKKAYSEAIDLAVKSNNYTGGHREAYYVIANSSNALKKYDNAIEAANKGLEFSTDLPSEKQARFYFELAMAYFNKKDNAKACENYKKANCGPYGQACKAQIANLKCK